MKSKKNTKVSIKMNIREGKHGIYLTTVVNGDKDILKAWGRQMHPSKNKALVIVKRHKRKLRRR